MNIDRKIKSLLDEGFSKKTLNSMSISHINILYGRIVKEQDSLEDKADETEKIATNLDIALDRAEKLKDELGEDDNPEEDEELEAETDSEDKEDEEEKAKKDKYIRQLEENIVSLLRQNLGKTIKKKDFMGLVEQGQPIKTPVKTPVKTPTKTPSRPKRKTPYEPKHKPGPKAKNVNKDAELPEFLKFDNLNIEFKDEQKS